MKLFNLQAILFMFLFSLLITGSMTTYTVIADSHDDDQEDETDTDQEDETEDEDDDRDIENDEREVSIETSDNEVQIKSENEMADREDEFKAEITTDDDAEIKVEYSSENDTLETEAEMKVQFIEIIEYQDNNSDGVYSEENDTVVSTYIMSDVGYKPIEYTTQSHTEGTEHIITVETNDGVFKVIIHIVGQMTNINGTDLKPTSLKIDIIITDFDYQQSDTKLALYSEVESTSEVEKDEDNSDDQIDEDEEAFKQSGTGIFAFYSWKKTADVDGSTTDVLASYEERTNSEQKLYLNYEHGQNIIHDPKLGVSIPLADGGSETDRTFRLWPDVSPALLFAITFVATAIALVLPVLIYRRRKH